jgi:putative flippase GtrA
VQGVRQKGSGIVAVVSTRPATPASPAAQRLLRAPGMRSAKRADWAQLLRFCIVGTSGYVINLCVFAALVHGADAHYQLAAIASFAVAWTSNFMLNKHWTFRRHVLTVMQQGARNLAVSLATLGLNLLALWAFVRGGAPELPAQAAAIALVTPLNFILNRRWSFR